MIPEKDLAAISFLCKESERGRRLSGEESRGPRGLHQRSDPWASGLAKKGQLRRSIQLQSRGRQTIENNNRSGYVPGALLALYAVGDRSNTGRRTERVFSPSDKSSQRARAHDKPV